MNPSLLSPLDNRVLQASPGGVDAYMVVRNEIDRLPGILDHHRHLGIDRFFIVDNDSTDGTAEYLLAQPDCLAYHTTHSFAASGCGMDWINTMVGWHGLHRWCLFIDADELFVYPHSDAIRLPDFCRFLRESGDEGLFAIMVDMYGTDGLNQDSFRTARSLLEACPFYDSDYVLRGRIPRPFARRFHDIEAVGGPRLRVFYPALRKAGPGRLFLARMLRALRHSPFGSALGLARLGLGACPPDITKIPLMFAAAGRMWTSNHRTTPLKLSPVTGALLHFKLLAGFAERARTEVARGEHWGAGSEYARYSAVLGENRSIKFHYAGSRRYEAPCDLVRDGIMQTSAHFDAFATCATVPGRKHVVREARGIS